MEYEVKKITAKHIRPMTQLIKAFGVKEFKKAFMNDDITKLAQGGANEEFIGFTIALTIFELVINNYENCEAEFFAFLESVTNLDTNQLEEIPLGDFANLLVDIFTAKDFSDFFSGVSKLFK